MPNPRTNHLPFRLHSNKYTAGINWFEIIVRPGNKDFSGYDNLQGVDFSGVNLQGANFVDCDLSKVDFQDCNLEGALFIHATLNAVDFSDADLTDADFTGAEIRGADFTSATLEDTNFNWVDGFGAEFSGNDLATASLCYGEFINANFVGADFGEKEICKIDLYNADLSGATMRNCIVQDASLVDTNLSGADLRGTSFHEPDVRDVDIASAQLSGSTRFNGFSWEPDGSRSWDTLAKSYNRIRKEFKNNALNASQTSLYFLQQRARTVEHLSERNYRAFGLRGAFELLTGYGVRARYPLFWTLFLIATTTLWYLLIPLSWEGGALHYSVSTFVTSAPHPPETSPNRVIDLITQMIVLIETYFGTTLIILLGYVLGNRDAI